MSYGQSGNCAVYHREYPTLIHQYMLFFLPTETSSHGAASSIITCSRSLLMSSFSHKIDEWMKEAEARPESAVMIVKLVARRLRELTERNEELLTENIALQNGTRVDEYQKRIAHLEYQLDLLKRRFGTDEVSLADLPTIPAERTTLSLLIYNAYGRIFRIEIDPDLQALGHIADETLQNSEQPRLLAVASNEEV